MQKHRLALTISLLVIVVFAVMGHFVPLYKKTGEIPPPKFSDICFSNMASQDYFRLIPNGMSGFNAEQQQLVSAGRVGCGETVNLRLYLW